MGIVYLFRLLEVTYNKFLPCMEIDMTVQETIETKLTNQLQPDHLEVINESHMHNVNPISN